MVFSEGGQRFHHGFSGENMERWEDISDTAGRFEMRFDGAAYLDFVGMIWDDTADGRP